MTDFQSLDPSALDRLREWGGEKLVGQMVRLFLDNSSARMDQMRAGANGRDPAEAERGAHSLKSSAANVGAERLRHLCAEMESAAVEGKIEVVIQLLPSIEEAYAEAISGLEEVIKGYTE